MSRGTATKRTRTSLRTSANILYTKAPFAPSWTMWSRTMLMYSCINPEQLGSSQREARLDLENVRYRQSDGFLQSPNLAASAIEEDYRLSLWKIPRHSQGRKRCSHDSQRVREELQRREPGVWLRVSGPRDLQVPSQESWRIQGNMRNTKIYIKYCYNNFS